MTCKELIEKLKTLPPDQPVIMAKDAEGNDYSPLDSLGFGWYVAESTWSGDLYSDEDMEELRGDGMGTDAVFVTCLWPTN